MKILLDTSAYSDWRRHGQWNEVISTASKIVMPAIVLGELRYGFQGGTQGAANETKLSRFLKHPAVDILPVGEATSLCYAHLKHFLREEGTPIPENDIWIAALALEHALPLVTSAAHFDRLPQVLRLRG